MSSFHSRRKIPTIWSEPEKKEHSWYLLQVCKLLGSEWCGPISLCLSTVELHPHDTGGTPSLRWKCMGMQRYSSGQTSNNLPVKSGSSAVLANQRSIALNEPTKSRRGLFHIFHSVPCKRETYLATIQTSCRLPWRNSTGFYPSQKFLLNSKGSA